jgi:hypothetical protein
MEENEMKITELIEMLEEALNLNGDLQINGIVRGQIFPIIEINCPDSDSPLYIELYKNNDQ